MGRVLNTGIGAFMMYLMDPASGRRRRVRLRQKATSGVNQAIDFVDVAIRDLQNRAVGVVAHARYLLRRDIDDETLQQRVASTLGRHVSHPRAIKASVENGEVLLVGEVLTRDVPGLIAAIELIPGVRSVTNHLEHHDTADVPSLQGGREISSSRNDMIPSNWSPSLRLAGTLAGSYFFMKSRRSNFLVRPFLKVGGALLVTRSTTNRPLAETFGLTKNRSNITVQKYTTVVAPMDEVFSFFSNFTNFPRFMRNVREVREVGEGRFHWTVAGPAGANVSWNATVTALEPNKRIAWRSDQDALVANAGEIHFEEVSNTETGVRIEMTYNPPAGVIGHAVAALFGSHPKKELDEDMARAKSFLETGKPARDASVREPREDREGDMSQSESTQRASDTAAS